MVHSYYSVFAPHIYSVRFQNTFRQIRVVKSSVLCFEINRLLNFLICHLAVALVYISIKWYVW